MDFSSFDNTKLVMLLADLQELHSEGVARPLFMGDGTRTVQASHAIIVEDQRLTDLLGELMVETHNELCRRFAKPLQKKKNVLSESDEEE